MNRVSKKRTFLFSFLLALVLALAFFHHTLVCYGVKCFLSSRLPRGETLVVNYEKGKWEDGAFVLHQLNLSRKSGLKSSGFDIKIENLRFVFSMQLFPFHFASQVVVDAPEIALLGGQKEGKSKKKGLYALCNQYFFKRELVINRGKIGFDSEKHSEAYFSIQTKQGTEKNGSLLLAPTEEALLTTPLAIDFSQKGKDFAFNLAFEDLDLPWVFSMARFFPIPLDPAIELSEGQLFGNLAFGLTPENHISHIQYDLKFLDFALSFTRYGTRFSAHQVNWKEHFTSNEEIGKWSSHPLFEKMWPYFIGDGEFLGAKITVDDPITGKHQGTVELRGKLQFSGRNQPLADFYGVFYKGDHEYPLRFTGEGLIEDDHNWKLALDISLHQERGEKMTSYFSLTSQEEKKYLFESQFQNISSDPADLIEHLVKVKYPHLKPYQMAEGTLNGSMTGWIEGKRFQRLEVKNVEIGDVLLKDDKNGFDFAARGIQGSGEFDFSTSDFFDGTFWELEISEGSFKGADQTYLTHLAANLSMHDQYVKPSKILGSVRGIEGEVRLEGLYTHLNLGIDFSLSPRDLFLVLGQSKAFEIAQFDDTLMLDFDMRLMTSRDELAAEGILEILREDQRADNLIFGAKWKVEDLLKLGILKGLSRGFFKGEHLSSHTINLPLEFFGKECKTKGYAAFEGTLNQEEISLTLDPTHLHFISPEVIISPSLAEEKAPFCQFFYEFEKKEWQGNIPLKNAHLVERSYGLEFDSFSSDIHLQGATFDFQNMFADAKGLKFAGVISLEYMEAGFAKLMIETDQISGSTSAVQEFLRHFHPFASLDLPLGGEVSSKTRGMKLEAYVGEKREMLSWEVSMKLDNGTYPITPTCSFEDLTTRFEWSFENQVFRLIDTDGYLCLGGAESPKNYSLNVPVACGNLKEGVWSYDLRLETQTHDICRLVGQAEQDKKNEEFKILIDQDLTRFFGAKVEFRELTLGSDGVISRIDLETDLSSRDLYHHLDFLVHAGLAPLKAATLKEMQSPRFEGETHLKIAFSRKDETFAFDAKSDHFAFGTIDLESLQIHAERKGSQFDLGCFRAGPLSMTAQMIKQEGHWSIPSFNVDWKNCRLRSEGGIYHKEKGSLRLPLSNLTVELLELLDLVPSLGEYDLSYFGGKMTTSGILALDLSKGLKEWSCETELQVIGKEFSKANLRIESAKPLQIRFSREEGFEIGEADFHFFHPRSNHLWAKCHLNNLTYKSEAKIWEGNGFNVVLPPEMLTYLGVMHAFPYLGAEEDRLILLQHSFRWDNQMELTFDFTLGDEVEINGRLKEGYYWINDKAWYLNDFCYYTKGGMLDLKMNTLLDDHPFDLHAEVKLLPHLRASVTIQEAILEERGGKDPLKIISDWSENEGFFIQSIDGAVCGLDFSFHHNPKGSFVDQMVLTGQLKVDVPTFSKCLPIAARDAIKEFEVGKGYEMSGDFILLKDKIWDSHFTGFLKGKKFELMGSEMETLLSEITIHTDHIELTHFNMSDASGIFKIEDLRISKTSDDKWKVSIPSIVVQNFRPSILKKIGRFRGQIKPLNIRDMSFHNIRGTLGEAKSFTGKGSLSFTNTFKRDYNILDIPFEILGRLGLDMGLLVPIRGRLDYVLTDGKIYLTQLSDSFSDGKRSKFFLSPAEPSFIDVDGTININIKMKQYVLLKITEPFTLSIAGTFDDVHYSLK